VIFTIVPKGYHVKSVYLDETTGVIAAKPGAGNKLFFEMSTIEASITREVGGKIMEAGFGTYIDSPISVKQKVAELLTAGRCSWCQGCHVILHGWLSP
jgi:3-hydroxyisobutyrate/3-hydroxypropionate dehydrogenase